MAVITISREFGSGGARIAAAAAQALGYHLADKNVMERILRQYGLIHLDAVTGALPNFWIYFDEQLRLTAGMLDLTIKALAQHGNIVILGRGSYAVLGGGLADVLHVRIQAPPAMRVQYVTVQYELSEADAAKRVAEADRARASFIERAYHARSDDTRAFDLVINLGTLAPESAARLIVEAAHILDEQPRNDTPRAADFLVSSTLADVVRDVLDHATHHA